MRPILLSERVYQVPERVYQVPVQQNGRKTDKRRQDVEINCMLYKQENRDNIEHVFASYQTHKEPLIPVHERHFWIFSPSTSVAWRLTGTIHFPQNTERKRRAAFETLSMTIMSVRLPSN